MQASPVRVGVVAGEASGDQLGGHLLAALHRRDPALRFEGIGGPAMLAQGLQAHFQIEDLAVRGYVEVLRHYRRIMRMRRDLGDRLLAAAVRGFIGIDSSDFNLGLARRLRSRGISAVQYVGPSVWAWRRWRLERIRRSVDHVLVLFPFEPELYRRAGIQATFVGHPVADTVPMLIDRQAARAELRLPQGKLLVALLPGSRRQELRYMAATFIGAAKLIHAAHPGVALVVPLVSRETRQMFEAAISAAGAFDLPITLLSGHSHAALAAADVAIVASGTATLEAALHRTPMVITYKQSPMTWALMRRMLYLPYIGLPNILAGEHIVDELIQDEATDRTLSAALLSLVADAPRRERMQSRFADIHAALRQGSAQRAADAVLRVLGRD